MSNAIENFQSEWKLSTRYFFVSITRLIPYHPRTMTKKYIANLAALTSSHLTELSDQLPAGDPLRAELSRLSETLDERFDLRVIECPVVEA
jgi:hypothetical protein